jgi:poly(beta-D-mannuronate) lyase
VTASADDGNVPANVLDNNLNTRWSANGDGQWIQFCLNNEATVTGVQIAFYQGNTRSSSFDILTGSDGNNWTTAASGLVSSGTSLNLQTFTFTPRTAKYVRIVGHGNSVNAWNSYTEVKIQTSSGANRTITGSPAKPAVANLMKVALDCYPNPFSGSSTISFSLPAAGPAQLTVYDITGKQVAVLVNSWLQAGNHQTTFASHSIPPGTYLLKMVYNGKIVTKKLLKK